MQEEEGERERILTLPTGRDRVSRAIFEARIGERGRVAGNIGSNIRQIEPFVARRQMARASPTKGWMQAFCDTRNSIATGYNKRPSDCRALPPSFEKFASPPRGENVFDRI